MKTMNKIGLVVSALMLAATVKASIVTNFYDDFSGSAGTLLNGTAPDIRPGSETWIGATGNIYADGHFNPVAGSPSAYLPFTMQQGKIYTFTADLTITNFDIAATNATDWAGIGIRTNNSPVTANIAGGPAYMFVRRNGSITANSAGGLVTNALGTVSSTIQLGIVLDTTAASAVDWTVTFTTNGGIYAANRALSDTQVVEGQTYYWSIGLFKSPGGNFDNVLVTEQIPEPTTIGLFSISGIALLWVRRHFVSR